jgi:hypothetical protein
MPRELAVAVLVAPFRTNDTVRPDMEAPPLVVSVAERVTKADGFAVVVPV